VPGWSLHWAWLTEGFRRPAAIVSSFEIPGQTRGSLQQWPMPSHVELASGAKVVKAFNASLAAVFEDAAQLKLPANLVYCGDEDGAKGTVSRLIEISCAARSSGRNGLWRALETDGLTELLKVPAHDDRVRR
jgi:hypothetical protein